MKAENHSVEKLDLVTLKGPDSFEMDKIDFSVYSMHYDHNKKNDKSKYHTFLVFYSGSVILSSSGPETEMVYNKFINIIKDNMEHLKENDASRMNIKESDLMFLENDEEEI